MRAARRMAGSATAATRIGGPGFCAGFGDQSRHQGRIREIGYVTHEEVLAQPQRTEDRVPRCADLFQHPRKLAEDVGAGGEVIDEGEADLDHRGKAPLRRQPVMASVRLDRNDKRIEREWPAFLAPAGIEGCAALRDRDAPPSRPPPCAGGRRARGAARPRWTFKSGFSCVGGDIIDENQEFEAVSGGHLRHASGARSLLRQQWHLRFGRWGRKRSKRVAR